jgi:hypothetical protein
MPQNEDKLAFATERAYALARSGNFEDFASIERALFAEGFEVEVPQLERLRLRDTLDEICIANRQFQAKAATARDDSAPTM